MVMNHGPYVKLVLGFLFTSLAFMVRTVSVMVSYVKVAIDTKCVKKLMDYKTAIKILFFTFICPLNEAAARSWLAKLRGNTPRNVKLDLKL